MHLSTTLLAHDHPFREKSWKAAFKMSPATKQIDTYKVQRYRLKSDGNANWVTCHAMINEMNSRLCDRSQWFLSKITRPFLGFALDHSLGIRFNLKRDRSLFAVLHYIKANKTFIGQTPDVSVKPKRRHKNLSHLVICRQNFYFLGPKALF